MRGHLTEKADVFGFGVVALEILSGRPNSDNSLDARKMYLLEWVYKNGVLFSSLLFQNTIAKLTYSFSVVIYCF